MSESARWQPEFAATAARVSIAGLAKIPTRLDNQIIVAFNLYSTEPRQWSDEATAVARVLANLRPAMCSTPPNCASRSNSARSCRKHWTHDSSSNKPNA